MMSHRLLWLLLVAMYSINLAACTNPIGSCAIEEKKSFSWLTPDSINKEEEDEIKTILFKSFSTAYEPYTKEFLKIQFPSKEAWLIATFEEEMQDFKAQKTPIRLCIAHHGSKIIGVATIEPDQAIRDTVYIRQLAIDPNTRAKVLEEI